MIAWRLLTSWDEIVVGGGSDIGHVNQTDDLEKLTPFISRPQVTGYRPTIDRATKEPAQQIGSRYSRRCRFHRAPTPRSRPVHTPFRGASQSHGPGDGWRLVIIRRPAPWKGTGCRLYLWTFAA